MLHNDVAHIYCTLFFVCLKPLCFFLEASKKQHSLLICVKQYSDQIFSVIIAEKRMSASSCSTKST